MDELEFNALADATLSKIESVLDNFLDDLDFETKPGGILEIEFPQGSKIIINRHSIAREIWVADRSGGFHFRPADGQWLDTREGTELWVKLDTLFKSHGIQGLKTPSVN